MFHLIRTAPVDILGGLPGEVSVLAPVEIGEFSLTPILP